jgi:hypothetical protein
LNLAIAYRIKKNAITPAFKKPGLAQQMMGLTQSDHVKAQKLHLKFCLPNNCRALRNVLRLKS